MSAPTALYRRYRPDSFAAVIGQEHVTAPLMTALDKNRVNHAYLFSGPRGCGKTTSARILARCLNCAKGPTSHPCGECDSCVELARGGAGSLDVIEIDAASHGGVDDARDLRERATFAPIRDRYKIFIIDEAHMVTSAGFNALLKIVEEPPEHIKFIFATTEPDKVIGTIRSRTHHYPFRLVPPEPLMAYLARLCEQENVAVAPGVLSLVVRAGGGSVRDSLSVLDQLMAGAPATGLDYDLAVDLLGYTHSSLLDDVVEALAASDSATVFKSVDRVIQTGHDPRRFVEDLLERFRDLIIVQAMPESAHAILRGTPDELIARMQTQAAQLGAAELSRAADVTNAAFNEMTGATSPRLHLELLGARLLLPGADSSTRGMATRLDQLERRINYAGTPTAASIGDATAGALSSPSTTPAPYDSMPATPSGGTSADAGSGGGIAAVRAQLARAKEAAGAEVAARHPQAGAPATLGGSNPPSSATAQVPAPAVSAAQPEATPSAAPPVQAPTPAQATQEGAPQSQPTQPARTWDDLPTPSGSADFTSQQQAAPSPQTQAPAQAPAPAPAPAPAQNNQQQPGGAAPQAHSGAPAVTTPEASAPASSGIEVIRRAWPEITAALKNIRTISWIFVNQSVVPQTFDGQELRVGIPSTGLINTFSSSGHMANLQQAINQVLGLTVQILPVDGEAPRASAEPNPKVQTGNPSPQRGGAGNNASPAVNPGPGPWQHSTPAQSAQVQPPAQSAQVQPPAQSAQVQAPAQSAQAPAQQSQNHATNPVQTPTQQHSPQPAPDLAPTTAPAHAPAPAPAPSTVPSSAPSNDSWGLPVEPQGRAEPAQSAARVATDTAASASSATAPASTPANSPTAGEPAPWDGPLEPSDPWDEPYPEHEPPADLYDTAAASTPDGLGYSGETAASPAASSHATPAPEPYVPPKISPISAWTTGWDAPATAEPVAAPATPEAPRRSEILAQQVAQQATNSAAADSSQDWGVSLGQTRRSDVADPGWGNMSSAPDWAQPAAAADVPAPATTAPATAAPQEGSHPGEAAQPASTPAPVATPTSHVATPPGNPTQPPAEASSVAQEDPASNGSGGGEKLSMYQRLANSSAAQAGRAQAPAVAVAAPYVEDVPSPDDVTIEESGVVGQAAVERILGGVLVEERSLNPNI